MLVHVGRPAASSLVLGKDGEEVGKPVLAVRTLLRGLVRVQCLPASAHADHPVVARAPHMRKGTLEERGRNRPDRAGVGFTDCAQLASPATHHRRRDEGTGFRERGREVTRVERAQVRQPVVARLWSR